MVKFREVLIEKNERIISLKDLNLIDLRRVMVTGGWNVVNLTEDRTVYFDQDNPGKYGDYDLNILENNDEVFDKIILLVYESSKIETSILRKKYLLENMFVEMKISDPGNQTMSSSSDIDKQPLEPTDQIIAESTVVQTNSIVNLNDDQNCQLLFENLNNLSCDQLISDELEDDDDILKKSIYFKENVHVLADENEEKKLNYYERSMLSYQRSILENLEHVNIRLTAVEQGMSLLYERQSMGTLIKLLNALYLIDIRQLDTRTLSSFQSKEMHLFCGTHIFYEGK